ncbi:serine hydrolase [Legionella saoudiensis]|uniref:serine hydrolase n=1 Tax=Legionella saoudiensis TaxID=1750561 RepID=UPI00072FC629|nr:serine hydrolase [Legionella saoudiensis]
MDKHGSSRGDFRTIYQGKSVDDLVIEYMEQHAIPGMSLAIVQAPYITRVVGYGLADVQSKRLVSTRTLFNIGQISTAFTAVAIMQLQEEEKLNLDDSIMAYLPSFAPPSWGKTSIRHLITHSSGIPDYTACEHFSYHKPYSATEIINFISEQPLLFSSGTAAQISASNFYLLGLIVEKASGMSYEAYVTKNQIERMGLKHTFFINSLSSVENETGNGTIPFKHSEFLNNPILVNPTEHAVGHSKEQASVPEISWTSSYANSGILASSEDISIWDIGLAGGILVKNAANRAFLYQSPILNNQKITGNAGWSFPGHSGLMHIKGNIPGFSAFLSRFTAANELVCVTLLANKENLADLDILARKIAAAFDIKLAAMDGGLTAETLQSPYSVPQTIERLSSIINKQGGKIFAHIDHSGEANKVSQHLLPTEVLIIGNPAKGTALMQENPAIALDLPLRVMVTEDSNGEVWLSFTDPIKLKENYRLNGDEAKQIGMALRNLCEKAVSIQSKF